MRLAETPMVQISAAEAVETADYSVRSTLVRRTTTTNEFSCIFLKTTPKFPFDTIVRPSGHGRVLAARSLCLFPG